MRAISPKKKKKNLQLPLSLSLQFTKMAAPYTSQQSVEEKNGIPMQNTAASPAQSPGYPPQQGGYPPQQGGYPPQQGGYPPQQGGYPPQQNGYPAQQNGYPPQGGYPQTQPYQPGQPGGYAAQPQMQQMQNSNLTVIQQPVSPVVTQQVVQPRGSSALGTCGVVLGVLSTVIYIICGCWWALPCSIIGIILGITSSSAGDAGNESSAKTQGGLSIVCSVAGFITIVVGIAIIVGVSISIVNASVATATSTVNDYNSNNYFFG